MAGVDKVASLMRELDIEGDIIHHEISGRSSLEAAKALDVPLERILKALIFKEGDRYVFVITSGDKKVDLKKLRLISGLERPRLARHEEILSLTGYRPGSIPPFAFYGIMPCYIEKSLLELDWAIGSAGSEYVGIKLRPYDLVRIGCKPYDLSK